MNGQHQGPKAPESKRRGASSGGAAESGHGKASSDDLVTKDELRTLVARIDELETSLHALAEYTHALALSKRGKPQMADLARRPQSHENADPQPEQGSRETSGGSGSGGLSALRRQRQEADALLYNWDHESDDPLKNPDEASISPYDVKDED